MTPRPWVYIASVTIQAVPLAAMFYLNSQRDKFEEDFKKNQDLSFKIQELKETRKNLITQLYKEPHREVSVCTRVLAAMYDQGRMINFNIGHENFKNEYAKAQAAFKLSDHEKEVNKMNDCRSLVRDNMEYIKHLLSEYSENIEEVREMAKKCGNRPVPSLLISTDKQKIEKRFNRFVKYCKPLDEQMGYDFSIYDERDFQNLLKKCSK